MKRALTPPAHQLYAQACYISLLDGRMTNPSWAPAIAFSQDWRTGLQARKHKWLKSAS